MPAVSLVIGIFACIGAAVVWRWAFGGDQDSGPRVDQVFERIRGRPEGLDRAGSKGAAADLYRDPQRRACRHCDALVLGAHHCPKQPREPWEEAPSNVRQIRRAS
jgi:hypothetical protein